MKVGASHQQGLLDALDLRSRLRFNAEKGQIWLDENRMLLQHAQAAGALRKELFDTLGVERARGMLVRMGFVAGQRDAELAKRLVGERSLYDVFLLGPVLHMLEGSVRAIPGDFDIDIEKGVFRGEFFWEDSWEAESHVQNMGPGHDMACWTQIGYASGYVTSFMNRFIVFRETACAAAGSERCRIYGQPAEDWNDPEYLRYFEAENLVEKLLGLQEELAALRARMDDKPADIQGDLLGASPAFRKSFSLLEKASDSNVTVLLLGETGVGKERFARWLHDHSPRADMPFIAINCAAIPHDLIESELFGAQKGAYTGAQQSRMGRFERAHGGTLFLDEVGDLSLAAQVKLLRVLQSGELERLGDERTRQVDVRLIAATNVNLPAAIARGQFRADLYYRLSTYPVTIPPLRDRSVDLPMMIEHLVQKYSRLYQKPVATLTDRALSALLRYPWPGNIRELENVLERGVLLAELGSPIELEQLFAGLSLRESDPEALNSDGRLCPVRREPLPETMADGSVASLASQLLAGDFNLERHELQLLELAVEQSGGNLAQAARRLGITRRQLSYRLASRQR